MKRVSGSLGKPIDDRLDAEDIAEVRFNENLARIAYQFDSLWSNQPRLAVYRDRYRKY